MKRDTLRNKLLTREQTEGRWGAVGESPLPWTKSARPLMSTDKTQNRGIAVLYTWT